MRKRITLLLLLTTVTASLLSKSPPPIEFRGAWLHTVGNREFKTMSSSQIKNYFRESLDQLEEAGINAVIFQVRPQADAFYLSEIEPWSRFLSGTQGVAPQELWDPLQFMIEESHKRGMELHAWCNPYRVTSNGEERLHPSHLYFQKPEIFKKYGEQLYFDPGHPEAIEHTLKVIADIVTRYDVDAIHFDDYFYPYPIKFEEFHDDDTFIKYGKEQGFEYWQKGDWRRSNVDSLIKRVNQTIKGIKPWVRFGVSPFGIYRNRHETPDSSGSATNGLSNYEQLFADILLWVERGWIDYNVPQLYWKIGHPAADYKTLIEWWQERSFERDLYIGQSISTFWERDIEDSTKNQFAAKMRMVRESENIAGNVWWPGWSIVKNSNSIKDSLAQRYQQNRALIPPYLHLDSIPPPAVKSLTYKEGKLSWSEKRGDNSLDKAHFFAIYRVESKEELQNFKELSPIAIVNEPHFRPSFREGEDKIGYFVVTAIDRCWNESSYSNIIRVKEP